MKMLTPEQELLIQYLMAGMNYTETAKALNISPKTVQRWLELPQVALAYQEAQTHIIDYVKKQVEQLAPKAIATLDESLNSGTLPQVRLKAAQIVLDRVAPVIKSSDDIQAVTPQHGLFIANYEYATTEELRIIEELQITLNKRKEEQEQGKIVPLQRRTG